MAFGLRDRLHRAHRHVGAIPGCPCLDTTWPDFRVYVVDVREGVVAPATSDPDPGPCPRCGASALRIEIIETKSNQPLSGGRFGWR
jgi:hypothetical protein